MSYEGQTINEGIDISEKIDIDSSEDHEDQEQETEFDIAVADLNDIVATNIRTESERKSSTDSQVNLNGANSGRKPSTSTEVETVEVEDDD